MILISHKLTLCMTAITNNFLCVVLVLIDTKVPNCYWVSLHCSINNNNNNNEVNLYSAITVQIYSIALLEKSSMQVHVPSNIQWNNLHLCVRKSLHKQVGFQLSLKWNNWLGFPNRKRKIIPNLRCCTRKSTISQRHFCLRSWHFKEPFTIIWTMGGGGSRLYMLVPITNS